MTLKYEVVSYKKKILGEGGKFFILPPWEGQI